MRRLRAKLLVLITCALCLSISGGCERIVRWMDGDKAASGGKETRGGQPGAAKAAAARPKRKRKPPKLIAKVTTQIPPKSVQGTPPPATEDLAAAISWLRTRASVGETRDLALRLVAHTTTALAGGRKSALVSIPPPTVRRLLEGEITSVRYDGGRATAWLRKGAKTRTLWFFARNGKWLWDLAGPRKAVKADPGPRHEFNRALTLAEATEGIRGTGPLVARFTTTAGSLACRLHTGDAPRSVGHFVALARGKRATLDQSVTPPVWTRVSAFDGTRMRVANGQAALVAGRTGKQADIGFHVADELSLGQRHDKPGVLGLLNDGPNTGAAGIYVTLRAAPEMDDRYTIIGHCPGKDALSKLAAAGNARIVSVVIQRGF